jgi:hypothetical protein
MFRPGTIDEFKSIVTKGKGFAKTNLYHVQLPTLGNGPNGKALGFLCSSVALPSRDLMAVERRVGIDLQQVVHGFQNPPVSMTFRVLNDQYARNYFEYWQENIVKPYGAEGRYIVNYPDNYCFPIHIYQLEKGVSYPVFNKQVDFSLGPININLDFDLDAGRSGKANYHWILERAYPTTVSQETFSDGEGAISEITVSFTYKSWKGEKINRKGEVGATASVGVSTDIGSRLGKKLYDILG